MRKTLSLIGMLMAVAVVAQAQQPTQPKTKATSTKAATKATSTTPTSKGDSAMLNRSNAQPVDINTASRADLIDAGWGQYADGIIASRPYSSVEQLSEKNIVPRTAFDEGATRFNVGSSDGAASPMRNQSAPAGETTTSPDMSTQKDSTNVPAPVPGSTAPKRDSTATPSR